MGRILIIDDEEVILGALKIILAGRGYEVSVAGDGEEALKILKSGKTVDLVLTDIHMPGMSGNDVAREIKGFKGRFIPVIAVTGSPRSAVDETFFDDLLFKPFKVKDLLEAIEKGMEAGGTRPAEGLEHGHPCPVS